MQKHFFALLLAVFLAFSLTPSAKAEEAPDVQPEQFEQPESVDLGEADEQEPIFVSRSWTMGGTIEFLGENDCYFEEGEEVLFRAVAEEGYVLFTVKGFNNIYNGYYTEDGSYVEIEDSIMEINDLGDGLYSFIMPDHSVRVYAEFWTEQDWQNAFPEGYFAGRFCDSRGSIEFLKDTMFFEEGEEVFFYITTEEDVTASDVVIHNSRELEDGSVEPIENSFVAFSTHEDGTYSFIMPANPVQIFVSFNGDQGYHWGNTDGYFICRSWTVGGTLELVSGWDYAEAGEEVVFSAVAEEGYTLESLRVFNGYLDEEGCINPNEDSNVEFTDNGDGTFSFIMPDNPVYIDAVYRDENWVDTYFVSRMWMQGAEPVFVNEDQEFAAEGDEVFFYVDLREGITIDSITVCNAGYDEEGIFVTFQDSYLDVTAHEDGTYSFIMPANPVVISVESSGECALPDGYFIGNSVEFGEFEFVNDIDWFATEGTEVIFRINTYEGHALDRVEIVNCTENEEGILEAIEGSFTEVTLNEDGTYSFIMPANPVIVYAAFDGGQEWYEDEGYFVCRSWTNGGTLEFLDEEQSYAEAGEEVFFSVTVDDGFTLGFIRVSNGFLDENGYLSPIEDSELEVIEHADGTYSFIMPDNPVYVYVEFFGEGYGLPDGYFVGNCVEFGEFEFVNDIDWFATEGTEVIFRINASEGYVLDRVEVMNCRVTEDGVIEPIEGSLTEVALNADGTYSFVMPANPVIINAVMYEDTIGNFIGRCPQEGGDLEFVNDDQRFATEGEVVSFRAVADQGYELDRVEVMNCRELEDGSVEAIDGSYVTVTKNADGTYSFFMPDNAVQVFAFFKEKVTTPVYNPYCPTFGWGWGFGFGFGGYNNIFNMVHHQIWNAFNYYHYPTHHGMMGRNCGWGFFF